MMMHCTKLPANPSDMLSSDGGSEDDSSLFDFFLVVSSIEVGLEANISGCSSTFLLNALGPHPLYAVQLFNFVAL